MMQTLRKILNKIHICVINELGDEGRFALSCQLFELHNWMNNLKTFKGDSNVNFHRFLEFKF